MRAVILAGGEGLRLRPLTNNTPKVLLPLNNKPICFYQIDWLKKYGIEDIIFAIGYLGDRIKEELVDGEKFGVKITYATEESSLNTAGAIRNAFETLGVKEKKDSFLVLNGDTLTDIDLSKILDFHFKKNSLLTISLVESSDSSSYGVVYYNSDGRILGFDEKPLNKKGRFLINAGIYFIQPEAIEYIPKKKRYSFEREFIPDLIEKNLPIFGYKTYGYWIDVGTLERYKKAQEDILFKSY